MSGRALAEPGGAVRGLLSTRAVPKVWGRRDLPEPFAAQAAGEEPIGEIWFASPAVLDDILVKYLFTSDKLSVQVHPSDEQANRAAGEAGKEECWLILAAEPGAKLAIGFRESVSPEAMRTAALDGSIEEMLDWREVRAGDFFYLPAGTVHAIGAGLSLVEVQQSSDTTFRLFDYGRPRALHLERAIHVAQGKVYDPRHYRKVSPATQALVEGPYFALTRLVGALDLAAARAFAQPVMVLPLAGAVSLSGKAVPPGSAAHAPSLEEFDFGADQVSLLVTSAG